MRHSLPSLSPTFSLFHFSYSDAFYGLIDDAYAFNVKAREVYAVLDHKVNNSNIPSRAFQLVRLS
jgi:hypothetical protein